MEGVISAITKDVGLKTIESLFIEMQISKGIVSNGTDIKKYRILCWSY